MIAIGLKSLLLVSCFAGMSEFDIIQTSNDAQVRTTLTSLGFDAGFPIKYVPNNYVGVDGTRMIGYRAIGIISNDPCHTHAVYFSDESRWVAAARDKKFSDLHIALAELRNGGHISHSEVIDNNYERMFDLDKDKEYLAEESFAIASQVEALWDVLGAVRNTLDVA
jgi:hypothetical protein